MCCVRPFFAAVLRSLIPICHCDLTELKTEAKKIAANEFILVFGKHSAGTGDTRTARKPPVCGTRGVFVAVLWFVVHLFRRITADHCRFTFTDLLKVNRVCVTWNINRVSGHCFCRNLSLLLLVEFAGAVFSLMIKREQDDIHDFILPIGPYHVILYDAIVMLWID